MIPSTIPLLLGALIRGAIRLWADDALDALLKDADGDGVPDLAEQFMTWLRKRARETPHQLDDRLVQMVDDWLLEHPTHWSVLRVWLEKMLLRAMAKRAAR